MYTIDQEVANQIAETVPMKYPKMELLFSVDEAAADKYEMKLRKEIEATSDETVARAVVAFLPMYLENKAITEYINLTGNQMLRTMMPEILTAEEAALMAQRDIMTMTADQVRQTAQIMKDYQRRFSR